MFSTIDSAVAFGTMLSKNPLVLAPMTTYSSYDDGMIREDEVVFLEHRARAGFGVVMTAACYVHKTGHAFQGQWACDRDETIPSLRAAADAIRRGGARSVLQIHHGGRQCPERLCGRVLSASAVKSSHAHASEPNPMTMSEIDEVVEAFGKAAARAVKAGFDGVEIHGANTYLLQQFVSPMTNHREDAYGTDRLRFSRDVVEEVMAQVPEGYPVGYRFSPEESEENGITWAHTTELIETLCRYPLAWLHISLRHYAQGSIRGEFEDPIASRVVAIINRRVPFINVGSIQRRSDVEAALAMRADAVAVGKAAITDPDWPSLMSQDREPTLLYQTENAPEALVIPQGLHNKILSAPGWFPMTT